MCRGRWSGGSLPRWISQQGYRNAYVVTSGSEDSGFFMRLCSHVFLFGSVMALKDAHVLILEPVARTLYGRKDFEDGIKLQTMRWGDCPGLSECHHKCPYKREAERLGFGRGEAMWPRRQT